MIGARPAKLQQLSPYSDSGAARNPIIPITANLTARSLQQVQFRRHVDNTLLFRVLETHSKHVDNLNLSSCTAHAQLMHSSCTAGTQSLSGLVLRELGVFIVAVARSWSTWSSGSSGGDGQIGRINSNIPIFQFPQLSVFARLTPDFFLFLIRNSRAHARLPFAII